MTSTGTKNNYHEYQWVRVGNTSIRVFWLTIEGVVGAGKSELLKIVVDRLEAEHGKEFVLSVPENLEALQETGLFQECNADPKRYAFQLQCMFFNARTQRFLDLWEEHMEMIAKTVDAIDFYGKTLYVVSERSIISDPIFMRVHHKLGNATDGELRDYLTLNAQWRRMYPIKPSLVLYCKAGETREECIDICDKRIEERGRPSEKELVTKDYNDTVFEFHERAFDGGNCLVHMGNAKDFCFVPVVDLCTKPNYRDDQREALTTSGNVLDIITRATTNRLLLEIK